MTGRALVPRRDEARRWRSRLVGVAGAAAVALLLGAGPLTAQTAAPGLPAGPQPSYLQYAEFAADESPASTRLKQAYNDAAKRYNEALYEYHVVLAQHDAQVDRYNVSSDPTEKRQARDAATALRTRLTGLRRDVTQRAAQVDAAARQASAAGVTVR